VLRLSGVEVRFGGTRALDGLDLVVEAGERVAVIGPSGAGKSTLIGLANGSVRPTAGSVEVLGSDPATLSGADARRLRARVGTVHQHLELVGPLRVVHNVNAGRIGSWPAWRSAWSLLRPQGVPEVAAALRDVGLEVRMHERTDRLSGGQQQRVAVARVLVQRPDLVLADEPASALDPVLTDRTMTLLTGVAAEGGGSALVSLHDPALALRHCSRVVGLVDGRVELDAPVQALTLADLTAFYAGDG